MSQASQGVKLGPRAVRDPRSFVRSGTFVGSLLLAVAPRIWMDRPLEALALGAAMCIGFALAYMIVVTIVDAGTSPKGHGGPALFPPPGTSRARD